MSITDILRPETLDFRQLSKYNTFYMKKIETIWHFLLLQALSEGVFRHTQQDLAKRFHMSLSTVHHALHTPTAIGAIRKESKFFVLEDAIKLMYYWASARNLNRRIFYQTYSDKPIQEIESFALPTSIFACYSAARIIMGEAPADYATVYFYDDPAHSQTYTHVFHRIQRSMRMFLSHKTPDIRVRPIHHSLLHLLISGTFRLVCQRLIKALEEKYMAYYHDLITEQSWQELIQQKTHPVCSYRRMGDVPYTKSLKSKDIDIIIDIPSFPASKLPMTSAKMIDA